VGRNDSWLIYKNAFIFFGVTLLLTNLLFSFGVIVSPFNRPTELIGGQSMLNNELSYNLCNGVYFSIPDQQESSVSRLESRLLFSKKI
jgi:hypothetical protein